MPPGCVYPLPTRGTAAPIARRVALGALAHHRAGAPVPVAIPDVRCQAGATGCGRLCAPCSATWLPPARVLRGKGPQRGGGAREGRGGAGWAPPGSRLAGTGTTHRAALHARHGGHRHADAGQHAGERGGRHGALGRAEPRAPVMTSSLPTASASASSACLTPHRTGWGPPRRRACATTHRHGSPTTLEAPGHQRRRPGPAAGGVCHPSVQPGRLRGGAAEHTDRKGAQTRPQCWPWLPRSSPPTHAASPVSATGHPGPSR